jgi:hypothetical protein
VPHDVGRHTVPCRRGTPWARTPRGALHHTCTVVPPIAAPPSSPTPLAPRAACARAVTRRPRRPTTGVAAVPAPRRRRTYAMLRLGLHVGESELPSQVSAPIKCNTPPLARATAEPPPAPWTPTQSSTLRPSSLPTRATPTSPRTRWSFHTRLLPRLDHILVGATAPAAAAAWPRRPCLPAISPLQVSAQIEPSWTLDPPQPLSRPRPPASSPESGRPHRPHGPRAALRGLNSFWGVLHKLRVWLWGFRSFQGSVCRFFKLLCVLAATLKNCIKS